MDCSGCGKCCEEGNLYLSLTPDDFSILFSYSKEKKKEIKYTKFGYIYLLTKCPAFDPKTKECLLHKKRPMGCRQFPLIIRNIEESYELGYTTSCYKIKKLIGNSTFSPINDDSGDFEMELPGNIGDIFDISKKEYQEMLNSYFLSHIKEEIIRKMNSNNTEDFLQYSKEVDLKESKEIFILQEKFELERFQSEYSKIKQIITESEYLESISNICKKIKII